jgi:hypothetical protein
MNEFAHQASPWGIAAKAVCVIGAALFLAWLIRTEEVRRPAAPEPASAETDAG